MSAPTRREVRAVLECLAGLGPPNKKAPRGEERGASEESGKRILSGRRRNCDDRGESFQPLASWYFLYRQCYGWDMVEPPVTSPRRASKVVRYGL